MADSDGSRTMSFSRALVTARLRAYDFLWAEMTKLGLRREDGWSIVELTREGRGGIEIVMRPMHMHLPSPEGMECVAAFVEETAAVHTQCKGPDGTQLRFGPP
jgi:hypothetical protein